MRLITLIFILISTLLFSQGIINNGASIVITSSANVYIDGDANGSYTNSGSGEIDSDGKISLEGSWINNGSGDVFVNNDNTGEVVFIGTTNQELGGSHKTVFENTTVNNGQTVYLTQDADINYNLTLTNGKLDLKDKKVDLGTTGDIVNETETNSITSTDGSGIVGNNTGTISARRTVNNVTNYNPAHLGIKITTPNDLGTIDIVRGHEIQTGSYNNGGTSTSGVARYYEIPGIGKLDVAGGISVDMYYWDAELNGLTEANIEGFHWVTEGSSSSWWTPLDGSVDVSNDLFTTSGNPYGDYFTTSTWYGFTWSDRFTLGSKDSPLPVVLTNVNTKCNEKGAKIEWTTQSEINNDYFTIEKSIDGVEFKELIQVEGAGNSNEINNYNFIDNNNYGQTYYRLSQTDYNGTTETFKIVSANCANINDASNIILFPNPAINNTTIKIDGENNFTTVILTDILGKQIKQKSIINNENIIEINTTNLSEGVYNVILKSDNSQTIKQLIITR